MQRELLIAQSLADAALASAGDAGAVQETWAWVLGEKHRWLAPLAKRMVRRFGSVLEERERIKLTTWILI